MLSVAARKSGSLPTCTCPLLPHPFNPLTDTDSRNADFAVAGVFGGRYVKVDSWYDAATLYNKLYHQGQIFRVVN